MRLVILLALAMGPTGTVWAADLEVVGERNVPAGKFADFTVKDRADVEWFVYPLPIQQVERGGGLSFAGEPGKYVVRATVIDFKAMKVLKSEYVQVTLGGTPIPPVPPTPPGPGPAGKSLKVLMMYDDTTTAATDADVRAALEKYTAGNYRIYPVGREADIPDEWWRNLANQVKQNPVPWIVVVKDGTIVSSALAPNGPADVIALLKKYGE